MNVAEERGAFTVATSVVPLHTHTHHRLTLPSQSELELDIAELKRLSEQATRPHVKEILNDFIAHAGTKK